MKKVKLGEIVNQIRGVSYKPEDIREEKDANAIAILRANNITDDGKINYEDMVFVDSKKVHQEQLLTAGDILICASSGSKNLVGKACYIEKDKSYSFGAFCKVVRPKDNVYKRYLAQFFQSPNYRSKISELSQGANINNIKNEHINELDIAIYSIKEQKEIADRLDKVSSLIEKRKTQLEKLNELIKSRFIEMFGDPITNSKNLPTERMEERFNLKAGITTAAENIHEFKKGKFEVPCYGGNGVRGYVEEKSYFGNYPIIGRQGAQCGNIQYATGEFHATEHAILVSLLKGDNTVWVYHLLKLMDLFRFHTGAAQPGLAVKSLNTIDVLIADRELQNQFASFVEQTDKLKLAIQKSIDKLETLKKSLMQQYFG